MYINAGERGSSVRQAVAMVMGTVVCQGYKTVWICSRELMAQFHRLVSLDSRVSQFSVASIAVMMGFHHYDHHGNNDIKANTKQKRLKGSVI